MPLVGFEIDPETETAIRALHASLGLPVSLRAVRIALLRTGLQADPTVLRDAALGAHRPTGRPPSSGTIPANAPIKPLSFGDAYRKAVAKNSELAKIRRGKK